MRSSRNGPWLILGTLLVASRLAYLPQYLVLPFLEGPLWDSNVYLRQAEAVLAGRFGDPALLAFSPLYGYVLAGFGAVEEPLWAVLFQSAIGAGAIWGWARVVARSLGEQAGLAAGLLLALYAPLMFFETKLLSETLGFALLVAGCGLFWSDAFRRGQARYGVAAGLVLASAVLARASLLFTLPFFVICALLPWRLDGPWRPRMRRGAALTLGLALVLGANGLRNQHYADLFVPVILVSSTSQQTSSGEWTGSLADLGHGGRAPSSWDVVDQAEARIARARAGRAEAPTGPMLDLGGWARRAPSLFLLTFRDYETGHQYGYYGERSELSALSWLPITFGALTALALMGLFWSWRRGPPLRHLLPLVPILLGTLATTTLYHPSTRYRLALVLVLSALAGAGLGALAKRDARRARTATLVLAGLAASFFAHRSATYEFNHPGTWDLSVAQAALEQGDIETAMSRVDSVERRGELRDATIRDRLRDLEARYPSLARQR